MCNCIREIEKKFSDDKGVRVECINLELLSSKLFSTLEYKKERKTEKILLLHSYCPICGKKYDD